MGNETDVRLLLLDARFTQRQQGTPKHNINRALVLLMLHSVDMMSITDIFLSPSDN